MNSNALREKKLEALLDASKILNSSKHTDQILKSLLELSINLIDGGDAGCIFLFNKETDLLDMYAYVGMGDWVKDVKLKPGESMTGICFVKNEPIFFADNQAVVKAMGTMLKPNAELSVKGNVIPERIFSSICCPLLHRGESLGVLVIDNFSNNAPLVEGDVELLNAISVQATIAIINARSLERELENNRKLEEYNKIIELQRDRYRLTTQVHSRFTDMVLKGSTIGDIITEIKQLTSKDILIFDLHNNIISHTLDEDLIEKIKSVLIKKLKKSEFYDRSSKRHYSVFPIIVNHEPLGWLCLVSSDAPLNENETITAERGATILAIELLKQNELNDLEQSLKGDFLDSLLSGENLPYLKKLSLNYHFDLKAVHRILLMDFSLESNLDSNTKAYEKRIRNCLKYFHDHLSLYLQRQYPGSVLLIRHHQLICLLEVNPVQSIEAFIEFVRSEHHLSDITIFKELYIKIGISDSFSDIQFFRTAYDNARHTAQMIQKDTSAVKCLYFKDIHIKRFLLANNPVELKQFAKMTLGPLLEYGNSSREDFLTTLSTYIKSNCNWTYTRDLLHIHGNTLTYRLSRIEDILRLKLDEYQDRLRLQIAFEILELFP